MGVPVDSFDPRMLASQAQSATSQGSWLNTIGTGLGTVSSAIAGAYQSRVAYNNAALAEQDKQNALSAGMLEEEKSRLATGQRIGEEKAAQAANNLDVNVGTSAQLRAATQGLGDLDAALIHYNAAREAYGYGLQASNARGTGALTGLATAFNVAGGTAKTYSSYLAGSTALTNQRLMFGQSGVPNG